MVLKHIIPALALLALSTPADAKYIFETRFNSGRVPAVMTAVDNDAEPLLERDYRNGYTTEGWTVAMAKGAQYAALSPSHSRTQKAQSNMLSCPALTITGERPMLRWKGRSIHPAFPEAYRVLVRESDSDTPVVLFQTEAEDDRWRTRAADLTPWIGKEVIISFECVSVNKYLLAIDDLYVGDPEEVAYQATVTNPEYVGLAWGYPGLDTGMAHVTGVLENMGMPLASGRVLCLAEGEVVAEMAIDGTFRCGDALDYDFEIPVSLNRATAYAIAVEDAEGARTTVAENRVFCSHFPRTLLLDEYTGLWCNNCPEGTIEVENLERRFGSQLVSVTLHVNDDLECAEYRAGATLYSVPWMLVNRNQEVAGSTASRFGDELDAPTPAHIEITGYEIEGDLLRAKAAVTWAEDLDNSGDRYRVGYLLTRDFITEEPVSEFTQSNSVSNVNGERFYYLPTKIQSDLSPNRNVAMSGEFAYEGRPYTLPSAMQAMQPFTAEWTMTRPEAVADLKEARLVAYVLDTRDGHVINACAQSLDKEVVSVCPPAAEADSDAPAEYFTLDGIKVQRPGKGLYIMRKGAEVRKVLM